MASENIYFKEKKFAAILEMRDIGQPRAMAESAKRDFL